MTIDTVTTLRQLHKHGAYFRIEDDHGPVAFIPDEQTYKQYLLWPKIQQFRPKYLTFCCQNTLPTASDYLGILPYDKIHYIRVWPSKENVEVKLFADVQEFIIVPRRPLDLSLDTPKRR